MQPYHEYIDFLKQKICDVPDEGFPVEPGDVNPKAKPHQAAIIEWAVRGGCRAIFAAFGLGKSVMQLDIVRIVLQRVSGRGLIVMPLNVRAEFAHDAALLGIDVKFIRTSEEIDGDGIYLTNYESIREGKIDVLQFKVVSLDEASVLRSFGSKTFGEMLFGDIQKVPYRFVATATPSPNEFQELLAYAHFLGIMDIGQARTRFFKRNSEKSDDLTLRPNKEAEFWMWVSSWSIFISKPSDLGFSDEGYDLPDLEVRWHEVRALGEDAGSDKSGQARMFRNAAIGLSEAAKEKRESLGIRVEKMGALMAERPEDHCVIWHDLEAERHAIAKVVPTAVSVYGSQDLEDREEAIRKFSHGEIQYLSTKPIIAGSGCNLQRHCHWAIFFGIGFKFNDFIQAIHRLQRFLQTHPVRIDIIYTEGEREIRRQLERKWQQHDEMRARMLEIIREYGLSNAAIKDQLTRKLGIDRQEISGENFTIVNNDCVLELREREGNSIDLILTSIPFSTQYEYSPNYADFGHTDDNEHFFRQMDFLSPELIRTLKPGRILAVHVKDRIMPSGMTHLGFQRLYPFHSDCIAHYEKHGFVLIGYKMIVTDVVRENNQTYRLGWTEQCKDATKMGYGLPEWLLMFRKPVTDTSDGYGDFPVVKSKEEYSRSRWQIDAHGFTRSSGDRLMTVEEWQSLEYKQIYRTFREKSRNEVYDFEEHVKIGEALDSVRRLPVDFMLLPPQSWHPDVWTDITRMRTLNSSQAQKGREMHICPLQFDIVDRVISQLSMPGETVLDPFGGLMTVPLRAMKLGRKGIGIELNTQYFLDGASYCKAAEYNMNVPSLFDYVDKDEPETDFETDTNTFKKVA